MPMNDDEKYVVFKRSEFENLLDVHDAWGMEMMRLEDAVVIRRRDLFAAPALDTYANSITIAIDVMCGHDMPLDEAIEASATIGRLQEIADYFHDQARKSWETQSRKLPD